MSGDEPLFGGFDPPEPALADNLSADQRRTVRQKVDVAAGRHPLTGEPAHPELGTCGECVHRVLRRHNGKTYPKCDRPGVPVSRGAGTDVRAWWPACPRFTPLPAGESR